MNAMLMYVLSLFIVSSSTVSMPMIDMVNKVRVDNGLKEVVYSERLTKSATAKACDMADNKYWDHTSPTGKTPWDFFKEVGYEYTFAGENLCRNLSEGDCMVAFMKSEGHKANILKKQYTEIGIGHCKNFTVQHFGKPKPYGIFNWGR